VGAHPEPKTHHQYRQHLFNKEQLKSIIMRAEQEKASHSF
jgi:hypothetical protein